MVYHHLLLVRLVNGKLSRPTIFPDGPFGSHIDWLTTEVPVLSCHAMLFKFSEFGLFIFCFPLLFHFLSGIPCFVISCHAPDCLHLCVHPVSYSSPSLWLCCCVFVLSKVCFCPWTCVFFNCFLPVNLTYLSPANFVLLPLLPDHLGTDLFSY